MWSLGIVLFVLLCGRLPFREGEIRSRSITGDTSEVAIPLYLSEPAAELIRALLCVCPVSSNTLCSLWQFNSEERLAMSALCHHPWLMSGQSEAVLDFRHNEISVNNIC